MKANQSSVAGEDNSSVSENLSSEALIAQLTQGSTQEVEQEVEAEEVEAEELPEGEIEEISELEETDETQEEETEEEAADEIDLLSLSPEQIQTLAKKGKSRLLERIGELTAQKKALQSQLEEIGTKPQVKAIPKEQNPFGELTTAEEIKAKYDSFEATLETTDRLLEEYDDYSADDIIQVGSQQFTKKQIKLANRNARDAIAKYLPAQAAHLQTIENYKTSNLQWQQLAKQEVPEINDEESSVGKAYQELVNDPLVSELKEKLPHLGVQIEYLLAHAARSKFGTAKKVAQGAGMKLKVKPPASPVGAGTSRQGQGQNSKYAEAMKRFEQSGSAEDWVAAQKYK
jgi:hypothetical protein